MTPSHATQKGTRYRYYVSRPLIDGTAKDASGQRIPAVALEALVTRRIRDWFTDASAILHAIPCPASDAARQKRRIERAKHRAAIWHELPPGDIRTLMLSIVARIQVHADRIDISLDRGRLARWLDGEPDDVGSPTRFQPDADPDVITLTIAARLKRVGKEMRLVVEDGSDSASPDASLLRILVRAYAIRDRVLQDRSLTLADIAKSERMVASYATRLFRLTLLAPDLVSAIIHGKHPPELTARRLMDDTRLPLDWPEQRRALGFV